MFIIVLLSVHVFLPVFLCKESFVQKLNQFYNFDHNIYLFTDPLTMLQEGIFDSDVPRTTLLLNRNKINQNSYKLIALSSGNNCFLLVFTNASRLTRKIQSNDIELNATMELSYWNLKIKIGFIVTTNMVPHKITNNGSFVKDVFDWSWSNLIVDVFVLLHSVDYDQIFTYNPYKSKEIKQVQPNHWWMYFPDKSSNLHGHKLNVSFLVEPDFLKLTPDGFKSKDGKMCEYILNGLKANLIVSIGTNQTFGSFLHNMIAKKSDFTPRRYALQHLEEPASRVFTYPVGTEEYILLVPGARPYNQFQAFLKNFTLNNSIINIMGPIMLIIVILWLFRAFKYEESMLFQSCVDVIGLLFTLDVNGTRNCTDVDVRLFVLSLSVGGFFFLNTILSIFISLLMQPVMVAEINTFDQFDKTPLKIKVAEKVYIPHFLELAALNGRDWKNRIEVARSQEDFVIQMYTYNTKYAYFTSNIRTDILMERQKRLPIRGFHLMREYLRTGYSSYLIGARAPFRQRVDHLIHQAFSAGLHEKWRRDTYLNLTKAGHFKRFHMVNEEPERKFAIPVMTLYGYLISIVVFLIELCYFHLKKLRVDRFAPKNFY